MADLIQIKASAGSGKTYTLTRHYLGHLINSTEAASGYACRNSSKKASPPSCFPQDILAITFTNAAAAEMRSRVISLLKKCAFASPDTNFELAPEKAVYWLEHFLRNAGALNVRTIDSLLHLIVRSGVLRLGLRPDFEPVFASEEALRPYLELLLQRAHDDDPAAHALLKDACRAIVHYDSGRGFSGGDKLFMQLGRLWDDLLLGNLDDLTDSASVQTKLKILQEDAKQAAVALIESAKRENVSWKKTAEDAVLGLACGQWNRSDSAFTLKSGPEELFLKNSLGSGRLKKEYEQYAQAAQKLSAAMPLYQSSLKQLPLIKLARTLIDAFMLNREQEGVLPSVLIPQMAASLLANTDSIPDTFCRLGVRLTHFLVDEFQDTNLDQWNILKPLVLEALSRGGSLTWVGDTKQSIYGWRKAMPTLFDDILQDSDLRAIVPNPEPACELAQNRRSRPVIVEHNNKIFSHLGDAHCAKEILRTLLPENTPIDVLEKSAAGLSQSYASAVQDTTENKLTGGLVQIESIDALDSEELQNTILERLCDLLQADLGQRRAWSDILILVRSNENARQASSALLENGIPVIAENSLLLGQQPIIQECLAFLKFLDNPDDDLAFWTIITGKIVLGHPLSAPLNWDEFHNWRALEQSKPIWRSFKNSWPQVWDKLFMPFYKLASLLTPYDALLEWLALLEVEYRYADERAFIRRFMEILQNAEFNGFASLGAFLEYWEKSGTQEKVPMPETIDAVRIMTIHKAKGLEAPVVIVPWTNFSNNASHELVTIEQDGLKLAVANSAKIGNAYYEGFAAQAVENLNLLYVALTRAKDELYIFRTSTQSGKQRKQPSLNSAFDLLLQKSGISLPYRNGEPEQASRQNSPGNKAPAEKPISSSESPKTLSLPSDCQQWRPMQWLPRLKIFRNPLKRKEFSKEDWGTFIHLCLELLHSHEDPVSAVQSVMDYAQDRFQSPLPKEPDFYKEIADALAWFASQPEFARWQAIGLSEYPLLDHEDHALRMDLLIRDDDTCLVLDYKTGENAENNQQDHIRQLRSYLRCLQESGEQNPCGILVYLDKRKFMAVTASKIGPMGSSFNEAFSGI